MCYWLSDNFNGCQDKQLSSPAKIAQYVKERYIKPFASKEYIFNGI